MRLAFIVLLASVMLANASPAAAQLAGHGGPVRALAISPDGATLISGSFDSSAIRWSLSREVAEQVLRFHEGAVNAVALLPDGRLATAGEDTRIALWTPGRPAPDAVLVGHTGPVAAIAVSPDGASVATASWDRTVRLWSLGGGPARVFEGHQQNVNGVAFMPDGKTLVSAGYDATLRFWPLGGSEASRVTTLPLPLTAVAVAPDGEIVAAATDGQLHFLSPAGDERELIEASPTPITALALSRTGEHLAAASIGGAVALVERKHHLVTEMLAGPPGPVWAAVFSPDEKVLFTGGADRVIRLWDLATGHQIGREDADNGRDPLAAYAGDPGARVFRACTACHSLTAAEGNRAGPTLHGIFGRRIATLPGYNFSEALKHLDIVWTPETLAKLFELGPSRFTPGTKMPEQLITAPEDRDALIKFLAHTTN
ncbi:MAG TPA: c-type cytochrome [Stellaceae bacterium]|nr:c-type cytochrome [Stellaceae bacterium]